MNNPQSKIDQPVLSAKHLEKRFGKKTGRQGCINQCNWGRDCWASWT